MRGGGGGPLTKKNHLHRKYYQKLIVVQEEIGENGASTFYYPGPVYDILKNSWPIYCPPKKIMHNLKVKETSSCPPKLPKYGLPPHQKHNGSFLMPSVRSVVGWFALLVSVIFFTT